MADAFASRGWLWTADGAGEGTETGPVGASPGLRPIADEIGGAGFGGVGVCAGSGANASVGRRPMGDGGAATTGGGVDTDGAGADSGLRPMGEEPAEGLCAVEADGW